MPPDGPAQVTRGRVLLLLVGACAVLVLLGVGVLTGFTPQVRLDAAASTAFYVGDRRPGWLYALLQVVTAPGLTVVRAVVYLPVLTRLGLRRRWGTMLWVAVAVLLIGPVTTALKAGFGRLRPQFPDGGARLGSLSYPSGHSSGIATLVAVALILAWPLLRPAARRWWLLAGAVLVVVVGLSRMWLGVHFLTDVIGGWALGIAWSLAVAWALGGLPGGRAALVPRRAAPA
jgi:membrane-associated phospholipid phosphatase